MKENEKSAFFSIFDVQWTFWTMIIEVGSPEELHFLILKALKNF
jgi:hypothetical protein